MGVHLDYIGKDLPLSLYKWHKWSKASLYFHSEHAKLWAHCIYGCISCVGMKVSVPGSWATLLRQLCLTCYSINLIHKLLLSEVQKVLKHAWISSFTCSVRLAGLSLISGEITFRRLCVSPIAAFHRAAGIPTWRWAMNVSAKAARRGKISGCNSVMSEVDTVSILLSSTV